MTPCRKLTRTTRADPHPRPDTVARPILPRTQPDPPPKTTSHPSRCRRGEICHRNARRGAPTPARAAARQGVSRGDARVSSGRLAAEATPRASTATAATAAVGFFRANPRLAPALAARQTRDAARPSRALASPSRASSASASEDFRSLGGCVIRPPRARRRRFAAGLRATSDDGAGAVKEKQSSPESSSNEEEEDRDENDGESLAEDDAAAVATSVSASKTRTSSSSTSTKKKSRAGKKLKGKLGKKKGKKATVAREAKAKAEAAAEAAAEAEAEADDAEENTASVGSSAAAVVEVDESPGDGPSIDERAAAAAAANERSPPKKGVDLLMPVDYLSPALAQKMARNGHLSALNTGVLEASTMETPEMASALNASSHGASSAGKKDLEGVLYTSEALDGDVGFPIKYDFAYCESPTPVFVMLPLDVISRDGLLQHVEALRVSLHTLKQIGVEGVMIDVWWGIVEREGPELYDWAAYLELLGMVRDAGLKLNAVMSFHACGANVGDYFKVTLPGWVLRAAEDDPDLFFTDQYGYRNPECISLWADNAMTLQGRTPLECYRDFMASFKKAVVDVNLMDTLSEVSVGCGPCGELRYPAYPENKISPGSSQWQFPGIGEFQCYDQRALGNLARAGSEAGHIEWGGAGPHDAGGYNNLPHETGFFRAHQGSWDSEYGQFFLSWYSGELVGHGDRMLRCARSVFGGRAKSGDPALAIKCAGVHWWYNSRSHAAELTAGYFNTRSGDNVPERDGYEPIVKICGKHGARLNFTCTEMRDIEHPFFSRCGPEGLLRQIRAAAARYGVKVAGENALCRFDQDAYDKIILNCRGEGDDPELWKTGALLPPMASFTFLRLSKELYEDENFNSFVRFVARMANETGTKVREAPVSPDEVLATLWSSEMLTSGLSGIRDETSSGFVAAQFSDL